MWIGMGSHVGVLVSLFIILPTKLRERDADKQDLSRVPQNIVHIL